MKSFIEFVTTEIHEELELDEANWMPDYSKHSTEHLQKLLEPGTLHKSESKYKMFIRRELKKRNLKQSNEELEFDEGLKSKVAAATLAACLTASGCKVGNTDMGEPTSGSISGKPHITQTVKKQVIKPSTSMREDTELDEVTKPKGVVDKKFGKPEAPSKSGFKTGQRVAHYRGMGKTLHGDVTNPDAVSGGKRGAMVKFSHGSEFVPHGELKDASQYWKDEDLAMRKERDKPKTK